MSRKLEVYKEQIIFKYRNGTPVSDICKEFNCHECTIQRFLRKIGEPTQLRKISDQDIKNILELHGQGITARQIDKKLGFSKTTTNRIFAKLGIDISDRKFEREIPLNVNKDDIINRYNNGESLREISRIYDCGIISVKNLLKKNKIKIRGIRDVAIPVNEDFFKEINSEVVAYVIGWWLSDGNIDKYGHICSLEITDLDILQEIANKMGYKGEIKIQYRGRFKTIYRLRIGSTKMAKDLIKIGIVPKKSNILKFPQVIPKELQKFSLLGLLEGDGCISKRENGQWSTSLVGTKDICENVSRICYENLGFNGSVFFRQNKLNKLYCFEIGGKHQLKKYLDWLYKDSTIHLDRKYQKYLEFCKEYKESEGVEELKQESKID